MIGIVLMGHLVVVILANILTFLYLSLSGNCCVDAVLASNFNPETPKVSLDNSVNSESFHRGTVREHALIGQRW